MKIQATLVAPALQFDHPVTLTDRMALQERQAAGFGEQVDQHHRLLIYRGAVGVGDFLEKFVPDIGPRRLNRKIIVDLARHAVSPRDVDTRDHPNRPVRSMQDRSSRSMPSASNPWLPGYE